MFCWSCFFTDLHFVERGTAEKISWCPGWLWLHLLTHADLVGDLSASARLCHWRCFVFDVLTLLDWTAGMLTMVIGIASKNYFSTGLYRLVLFSILSPLPLDSWLEGMLMLWECFITVDLEQSKLTRGYQWLFSQSGFLILRHHEYGKFCIGEHFI